MKMTSALLAGIISASPFFGPAIKPEPIALKAPALIHQGKGKGGNKSTSGKRFMRGSWYLQRKGPFTNNRENSRRVKQIQRGIIKVSS